MIGYVTYRSWGRGWQLPRFYECGIVPAEKVVNTVGAGDSYIAGFTKGVIDGLDIPACMKAGAELSSRVIGSFEPY